MAQPNSQRKKAVIPALIAWTLCFLLVLLVISVLMVVWRWNFGPEDKAPRVTTFTADGKDDPVLAEMFIQRSKRLLRPDLIWKASFARPDARDLLSFELGQRTNDAIQEPLTSSALKDLQIKVGGLEISGITKYLSQFSARPRFTLCGTLVTYTDSISLTITLHELDEVKQTWTKSANLPNGADDRTRKGAIETLIDNLIFDVAVFFRDLGSSDDKKAGKFDASMLANLYRGRQSLGNYYRDGRPEDLKRAVEYLRELVRQQPEYVDGLLLLGLAFHENRLDEDAVRVFDRVLQLRRTPANDVEKRQLVDAQFMRAKAKFFLYDWDPTCEAIKEFGVLQENAKKFMNAAAPAEKDQFSSALARAQEEEAHCYGHLIAYLGGMNDAEIDSRMQKLPGYLRGSCSKRTEAATFCKNASDAVRTKAETTVSQLNDHSHTDLEAHLNEVKGYATYRAAFWIPPVNADKYRKECENALDLLKRAEQIRISDYYALLQNIGMIYLDRRCFAEPEWWETGADYFRRSIALTPDDYYGHSQLALAAARRAMQAAEPAKRTAIDEGLKHVRESLSLRPSEGPTKEIDLLLNLLLVHSTEDENARTRDLNRWKASFESSFGATPAPRRRFLRALAGCEDLRLAKDSAGFQRVKTELKSELQAIKNDVTGTKDERWESLDLYNAALNLEDELSGMTFDQRKDIRVNSEAALPLL
jgi:tetratricopeptide (TPR) repeat protein